MAIIESFQKSNIKLIRHPGVRSLARLLKARVKAQPKS